MTAGIHHLKDLLSISVIVFWPNIYTLASGTRVRQCCRHGL